MVVSGPMAEIFGRDPLQFFTNVVKAEKGKMILLTARLSERTGITEWTVTAAHRRWRSTMKANSSMSALQVALVLCLWCLRSAALVKDEANRMAFGFPIGPHAADAAPFDWSRYRSYGAEQGDGGASLIAILTIAIPILVAIAPIVLPLLIDLVGGAVDAGGKVIADAKKGKEAEEAELKKKEADAGKIFGVPVEAVVGIAAGVGALLLLWK